MNKRQELEIFMAHHNKNIINVMKLLSYSKEEF